MCFFETILSIFAEWKINVFVYFTIETDNHRFITNICIQHQDRFFVSVTFINAINLISSDRFSQKNPVVWGYQRPLWSVKTSLRQFLTHSWSVMSQFSMQTTDSASQSTSQSFLWFDSFNFWILFSVRTTPNHPNKIYSSLMPAMRYFWIFGLFLNSHVWFSHDQR